MNINQKFSKNFQSIPTIHDNSRRFTSVSLKNFQGMAIKLSIVLENRRAKSNGKYPVKVRFNFKGQAYYIATGVEINENNFSSGRVVGLSNSSVYNSIITNKINYIENVLENLQLRGLLKTKFENGSDLKRFIENADTAFDDLDREVRDELNFKSYVNRHAGKYSSRSSANQFYLMLKKVDSFCGADKLWLNDITVGWLKDFENFCDRTGMSVNGKGVYLRAIRTIMNDAIDRELLGIDKYPFRRFKIKRADTKHRNLPVQAIRDIINYDCSSAPHIARYRDLFMLSFYLCGMNIKDILLLTYKDMQNGYINTIRNKTLVPVHLKIEPEALSIIQRYKGKNFLLNIMDTYKNPDDFRRRMNKNLKIIFPFITVYWARHSWATIAAELDIPDPVIDIAMGHKLKGMSFIYVSRNINKVWTANRQVIDYVNSV